MEDSPQNQALNQQEVSGKIIILSAPSGCGKTTIAKKLLARNPNLHLSISTTTRKPREGETDGKDYFFKSKAQFLAQASNNEFIEQAEIYGNYYGTPKDCVLNHLQAGHDILFDIDPQGAKNIIQHMPEITLAIYILPPSLITLKQRLIDRCSDEASEIDKRLDSAKSEMEQSKYYHHIITNNKLDETINTLEGIISNYKKTSQYVN